MSINSKFIALKEYVPIGNPSLSNFETKSEEISLINNENDILVIVEKSKKSKEINFKKSKAINLSSGIIEIILRTLKTLRSLNKRKLELFGIWINEIKTIVVSNKFHPLLKKLIFFGSPIKRIESSKTKKIVIK